MFIHSTCFFNNLQLHEYLQELHVISYSSNPLLAATDNMSTQKYYVKILIIQNNLPPGAQRTLILYNNVS